MDSSRCGNRDTTISAQNLFTRPAVIPKRRSLEVAGGHQSRQTLQRTKELVPFIDSIGLKWTYCTQQPGICQKNKIDVSDSLFAQNLPTRRTASAAYRPSKIRRRSYRWNFPRGRELLALFHKKFVQPGFQLCRRSEEAISGLSESQLRPSSSDAETTAQQQILQQHMTRNLDLSESQLRPSSSDAETTAQQRILQQHMTRNPASFSGNILSSLCDGGSPKGCLCSGDYSFYLNKTENTIGLLNPPCHNRMLLSAERTQSVRSNVVEKSDNSHAFEESTSSACKNATMKCLHVCASNACQNTCQCFLALDNMRNACTKYACFHASKNNASFFIHKNGKHACPTDACFSVSLNDACEVHKRALDNAPSKTRASHVQKKSLKHRHTS